MKLAESRVHLPSVSTVGTGDITVFACLSDPFTWAEVPLILSKLPLYTGEGCWILHLILDSQNIYLSELHY